MDTKFTPKYPRPTGGIKAHRQLADGTTEVVSLLDVKVGDKVTIRNHAGRPMTFHLAKRGTGRGPQKPTLLSKLDAQQRKMPESVVRKLAALGPKR